MNLQSLEQSVVKALTSVGSIAADVGPIANTIVSQIPTFINLADSAVTFLEDGAKALTGANKLTLVKEMAQAAVNDLGLSNDAAQIEAAFSAIWAVLAPAVTVIVQLRKLGLVKF